MRVNISHGSPRCGLSSVGAHTQLSTCFQWLASEDAALLSTFRLATASRTSSPSVALASSSTRSPMPSLPRRPFCRSERYFLFESSSCFCVCFLHQHNLMQFYSLCIL